MSKRRARRQFCAGIEKLESRYLLAVAAVPDQLLSVSEPAAVLVAGKFVSANAVSGNVVSGNVVGGNVVAGNADLVSVSRSGRADVAVNAGNNSWLTIHSSQPFSANALNGNMPDADALGGAVLGGTVGLINGDPLDDLVLLTGASVSVLRSNGQGGWLAPQSVLVAGVLDPVTHPLVQPTLAYLGGDVAVDFVTPLPQSNQIAVLLGRTNGFGAPAYLNSGATTPLAVATGDVIGSPVPDVIVGHADGRLTFFEGAADGTLVARGDLTRQLSIGSLVAIDVADLGGNSAAQIVVTGASGAKVLTGSSPASQSNPIRNGDFTVGLSEWTVQTEGTPSSQTGTGQTGTGQTGTGQTGTGQTGTGQTGTGQTGVGQTAGRVNAQSGFAQFTENHSFLTSLSQTFVVPSNPQTLSFDVLSLGLEAAGSGQIPDAFEVSLLDANSQSLVGTHSANSTAFINFVSGEAAGPEINLNTASAPEASAFGSQAALVPALGVGVSVVGSRVTLDISGLVPGREATLVFDLIGNPAGSLLGDSASNPATAVMGQQIGGMLGQQAGSLSTAAIDHVAVTPGLARDERFSVTTLAGPFGALRDAAIGDVDGDGLKDIVIADAGAQRGLVFNGDGQGGYLRSVLGLSAFGGPDRLALGPLTAGDSIADIAVSVAGQAALVTPLVADGTVPTARLVAPDASSPIQLGATQSAAGELGQFVWQFSESMYAPSATTSGSASNKASYKVYHYGPNGVDNGGSGDDYVYTIQSATYSGATFQATLRLDPTVLSNPQLTPGSQYRVMALGANATSGLRDMAGNRLDGGQNVSTVLSLVRSPDLSPIAPIAVDEGGLATLSTTLTHNTYAASYRATIDWGDGSSSTLVGAGTFPTENFQATHRYADDGTYPVTVSVFDRTTQVASTQATATVRNVPPTVTPRAGLTATEAVLKTFTLADFSEPGFTSTVGGTAETFTARIDWGDGTAVQHVPIPATSGSPGVPTTGTVSIAHAYTKYGTYSPVLTIRDDDGGAQSATLQIAVANVAPLPTLPTTIRGDEGSSIALGLTAVDPGSGPMAALIAWGDGTTSNHTATLQGGQWVFDARHVYADNGAYSLSAQVSDGHDTASLARSVQIASIAPTITATPQLATVHVPLVISTIEVSDPGFSMPFGSRVETFTAATIDWGDGTQSTKATITHFVAGSPGAPTTARLSAQHVYSTVGTFTARVTVTDDDGASSTASFRVGVSQASGACLPILDFERTATGSAIAHGTRAAEQWSAWGVHIASHNPTRHPPTIVDVVDEDDDEDEDDEDEDGDEDRRADDEGDDDDRDWHSPRRVLIIAEDEDDKGDEIDDDKGKLIFRFDRAVDIDDVRMLDIDEGERAFFRWYNAQGVLLGSQTLRGVDGGHGHDHDDDDDDDDDDDNDDSGNKLQTAVLDARALSRLEIELTDGGAVAEIVFCRQLDPAGQVRVVGAGSADEGSSYTLELDRRGLPIGTWFVNWGDGHTQTVAGATTQLTHIYADGPVAASIYATATSGDNIFRAPTKSVQVANVVPALTISGSSTATAGQPYTLNLASTDPGQDTLQGWIVDWGDGQRQSISGRPTQATHTYSAAGSYFAKAHAYDEDFNLSGSPFSTPLGAAWLSNRLAISVAPNSSIFPPPIPPAPTQFFVVDTNDQSYRYATGGAPLGQFGLASSLNARGATTTSHGNPMWIVSEEGFTTDKVYVYDTRTQSLLGSWQASGLSNPEGIATNGTSLWIVDDDSNRVYRYNAAAARRGGSQSPSNSFPLASGNQNPKGIATDGRLLWVVDAGSDRVFVYDLQGRSLNWWQLDPANSDATDLTVKPGSDGLWVVDNVDRRVYAYPKNRLSHLGSQTSSGSFALAAGNTNPQGLADPGEEIALDRLVTTTIPATTVYDWTFEATANQQIYVNFQALDGPGIFDQMSTSLIAPSGNVLYSRGGWLKHHFDSGTLTLAESGVYTLRGAAPVAADAVAQLKVWTVPPPQVAPIQLGSSSVPAPVVQGGLESPGQQDHWTFTGTAGTNFYFDALSLETVFGGDLQLNVVAPDGQIISSRTSSREFGLDQLVTLPANGLYTLVAQAYLDGSQMPVYSFQAWSVPPDDVAAIQYRQTVVGRIEIPGAADQWRFHATAGQEIFLDFLSVVGGVANLQVLLTAPDGSTLYSNSFSRPYGLDGQLTLPQTGVYTLTAKDAGGGATLFDYSFIAWDIPPEVPEVAALNVPLSGSIVPGQRHVYLIDATAGTELLVDAIETQGRTLGITLVAPDGTVVGSRITLDRIITLPQTGTYQAIVATASEDILNFGNYGAYSFRLQDASSPAVGGLDSLGTRFVVGFPRNLRELLDPTVPTFSLSITSPTTTSGTVQIPGLNWFASFDVAAGQTTTIALPGDVEIYDSDLIENRGVIVTAVHEVAVYGLNRFPASTDGFTALPVDALGTQYTVLSFPNTAGLLFGGGTNFTLVGAVDNTLVTITPSTSVGSRAAGVPYSILLNQGQTYTLLHGTPTPIGADLTGTRIASTQPISVFGGNTAARVPSSSFAAADHLVEQLPPDSAWGKQFYTFPLATRTGGDTIRVLARADNTQVTLNGTVVATLAATQVYQTILTAPSTIRTSQPALVAQLSNSSTFDGVTSDPFMMLVPPSEQFQSDYTLSTPSTGIDANFANLVVPTAALVSLRRDGQSVSAAAFAPIGASGYSGAAIPISVGSHRFTADVPFGVSIYGFAAFDSYGYFGGLSLAPLSQISSLSVSPATANLALRTQHVVTATLTDSTGLGQRGIRVQFTVTGSHPTSFYSFTDSTGRATFQYSGQTLGLDTISVTAAGLTQSTTASWTSSPPIIAIASPTPGSDLATGKYLLTGSARPGTPGAAIAEVLVNGRHVDTIDASGQFFAPFDLAVGANSFIVTAIDSQGQQASTSISLTGLAAAPPGQFDQAASLDVTNSAHVRFSKTTFHRGTNRLSTAMQLVNTGLDPLDATLAARFDQLEPGVVNLANPDALLPDGSPLILFDSEISASGLLPNQSTATTSVRYDNPSRDRFAAEISVLASANRPPRFTSAPLLLAETGRPYRYTAQAADSDGNRLTYSLTTAPSGLSIDPATGRLTWTPSDADAGRHDIVVSVSDGRGGTATQTYSLLAVAPTSALNRPPAITSAPRVSLALDTAYVYQVRAADLDGDTLSYSLTAAPPGMVITPGGGRVLSPALAAGNYPIGIQVSDGRGGLARQSYTLSVGSTGPAVPSILSTPAVTAYPHSLYSYTLTASDTSRTPLVFSLLQAPVGMSLDSTTGRITWQPTAAQLGQHTVTIQVTNGLSRFALQSYTLQVLALQPNQAPHFNSDPLRLSTVDEFYTYAASASDPESQTLTYSLATFPAGMTIDASTGLITYTPTAPTTATPTSPAAPHRVTLIAQDPQGLRAIQSYLLDVRRPNTPPTFTSTPIITINLGEHYRYNALATDTEDEVTYSLITTPTDPSLTGPHAPQLDPRSGTLTWQARLQDIGPHAITLRATDSRGLFTDQQFSLTVQPDTQPPTLSIALSAEAINPGEAATAQVVAVDPSGIATLALTVNGGPVALDGQGRYTLTTTVPGLYRLVASASDTSGNVATAVENLRVINPNDSTPPSIALASPTPDSILTYLTDIVGTVTDPNLEFYRLEYSLAHTNQWTTFAERTFTAGQTGVTNAVLGTFDPTMLQRDVYSLKIAAQDAGGNISFFQWEVSVEGQAVLGNYSMNFVDLQIPLAGIPITIGRTYDTVDAQFSGDFGFGWRLDVGTPRIIESVRVSDSELAGAGSLTANPFRTGTRVYMNTPDGRRVGFTFTPEVAGGLLGAVWTPKFTADPGVDYRLEVAYASLSQRTDGTFGLYFFDLPYNPDNYTLISKDQVRYTYNQFSDLQLQKIEDRNSVTLTFDATGIHSSIGPEVFWTRDSLGRIIQITDPSGHAIRYAYNSAGDLLSVSNAVGDTVSMTYMASPPHFIRSVIDARGITVQEVSYSSEKRLSGIRDASGASTAHRYDVANQTEVLADRLGNESIVRFDKEGNITNVTDPLGNTVSIIYNAQNLPIQITDARGNVTRMEYDERRNMTKEIDALGGVSTFAYNLKNDIVSKTDALGHIVSYEYDALGNRTAIVDQLGFRTAMVPDSQGRTKSLTTPKGQTWQFVYGTFDAPDRTVHPDGNYRDTLYNANGELTGITDENGKSVVFERDSAGRETRTVDPLGNQILIAYEAGLARQMTDQLGRVSRYEYDARGRVVREINPLGGSVVTQYDANDRIIARTDENGNTSRWEYDKNNRVVKRINALGFATQMTYDQAGNVVRDIDSSGAITSYTYDALNRLVSTSLPDGSITRTIYDALGRVTSTVGPRGETTTFVYDDANQLIQVTDPMLGVYKQSFDPVGNLLSTTDPRGNSTVRSYDNRNRLLQVTDASGFQTRYDLDSVGRVIRFTDPDGSQTSFQYDANGKVISMKAADGGINRYQYDASGNRLRVEDPLGRVSLTTYDELDRAVTSVDSKGAITSMQYDAVGNIIRMTDASGNVTRWSYDALNRVSQSVDPLGGAEQFIYDNVALACGCVQANGRGHLSEYIDKTGRHTVYKYDSRNRNTHAIYRNADGTEVDQIQRTFDASGNLTSLRDNDSQLSFTYDLNNRLVTADNSGTPGVRSTVLTSTWDAAGNRTQVTDSDGVSVISTYDPRNLLKTQSWSGPSVGNAGIAPARVDFSYNGRGQKTQLLRSSDTTGTPVVSKTVRSYDSVGRADVISHRSAIDSVMAQFDTDWNVASELAAWTIDGQRSTYQYDLVGQLTQADHQTPGLSNESFSYDATGNRIGSGKTIGANNRLLSDERFDYTYDAEGNTLSKTDRATGQEQRFRYDHENRMTHTETRSSSGAVLSRVDYRFDALGRRIARTVDSDGDGPSAPTVETFVHDGTDVWLDADGSGQILTRYLHGDDIDEPLARYRPGAGTAWYLTDHLGSVRAISDASGAIVDRIVYDSFGTIISETSPATGDRIKFTGREWDAEAGLYYYRSRMYDPSSGRFLSEDPIGFAAGDANLHRYVGNMPGAYTDPSGHVAMADYGGALGFSRIGIAFASGFTGYTFGYTCGYLNAITVQGLKGAEADFYAKRHGLLVGSIDFAASITLNIKGTIASQVFGVALFGAGALGLTVSAQIATGEKSASGPAIIASNICTAISAVGGYQVGQAASKVAGGVCRAGPKEAARDILVLGRGTPDSLADVAATVGGRVINNPSVSGNPRALWKHIYREMRKADEIVQVLDDIPTKQVGGKGSGEWARAEKIFIDCMETLRKKRTTIYRADIGLE